ncbi:S16 family serine protease [Thermogladius sp. 4427co]|uniref:S16 family serine protease n=1 Tax=Thermogladius sp. 4427co TaxID=3450718 RepID=UPI003F7A2426
MARHTAIVVLVFVLILSILTPYTLEAASGYLNYSYVRTVTIYAPAVTSSGAGVLTNIRLSIAYPGSGRVFFSALPFTELDTQAAARVAAWVASSLAGVRFYDYDFFVSMESQAPTVGGPSASALMTVGFLSLFLNISIKPYATMTGMINPDGSIGPVGGIREKLDAAREMGFKLFLIPYGQRFYTYPVVNQTITPFGIIRRVTYQTIDLVSYGRSIGVDVVEVKTVREALEYLTGYTLKCQPMANITLPAIIADFIRNITIRTISEANNTFMNAADVASSLSGNWMYYGYLNQVLSQAKSYLQGAENYTRQGMFLIGYSYAFRSLVYSTYSLWLGQYLMNKLSIDDIVRNINATITETAQVLGSINPFNQTYAAFETFIDNLASYYDALIQFYNGLNATSLTSQLNQLAYSYTELRLLPEWLKLTKMVSGGPVVDPATANKLAYMLYSLASTNVPYAETLASEAGVSASSLALAEDYYGAAQQALASNNTLALIGLGVYASAYSILALHQMFSQGQAITRDLVETIGGEAYCLLSRANFTSFMALLYYEYGLEALKASSLEESLAAFSASILYSQVLEQAVTTPPGATGITVTQVATPSATSGSSTQTPVSATGTPPETTTPQTLKMPIATALLISLIALVSLIIGIFLLVRSRMGT